VVKPRQAATLLAFGARQSELDELLAYNHNPFASDELFAAPRLPLDDELFVAFWEQCAAEAASRGSFAVLRDKLPQLRFSIAEGISQTDPYLAATRRGLAPEELRQDSGLALAQPQRLEIVLHLGPGGKIPLLITRCREDFVLLVQALTRRNEPWPVPAAMGAQMVSGYLNWERLHALRRAWEATAPARRATASWDEERQRLRSRPELYQDRFILLSDGPYSAVAGAELGLDEDHWRDLSLAIRREHECTHYFTRRLFGSMRNNLLDELIADYVGVGSAVGRLRPDWLLRFLGLDEPSRYRKSGRLEVYRGTPPLSDGAFAVLQELARTAVANLARFDASACPPLDTPLGRALLIAALASLRLEDLAGPDGAALLGAAYERARGWRPGPAAERFSA
jgi:hypothetical protein